MTATPPLLLILVDALEFRKARRMRALRDMPLVVPLRPGFGFSVNLDAELFAGATADEVGFFNEWTYDPEGSPFPRLGWMGSFLDSCGSVYPMDRLLHRIMGRLLFRTSLGNIPFSQLHLFKPTKVAVWDTEFPLPSLFSEFRDLEVVAAHLIPRPAPGIGDRDAAAVAVALHKIRQRKAVFLYLVDLDRVGHVFGPASPEHRRMIDRLDGWLEQLVRTFCDVSPTGQVVLLSDHGMAPVRRSVTIPFRQIAGRSGEDTYVYFLDHTMCRVWSKRGDLLERIRDHLARVDFGEIVRDEERRCAGFASRRWGDLIFLLNEGIVFSPSTYGRGVPAGMHGYHPNCDTQTAVFCYRGPRKDEVRSFVSDRQLHSRRLYQIVRTVLGAST